MSAEVEQVSSGLEGVLACESSITYLDGLQDPSVLEYRGYNIHDIAETARFEEIVYLLFEGRLPKAAELSAFDAELRGLRDVPSELIQLLEMVPTYAHQMAARPCTASVRAWTCCRPTLSRAMQPTTSSC